MKYVRNAWYVAGWSHELSAGELFAIAILNEPLVIYRTESGKVVAMEDRCVHRLAPLSRGRCEGDRLRCMYHGLLFDPDGAVVEIPGQDVIPERARVRTYRAVDKHSWIWIWMGDPELADEALIPPAVGLDDPNYLLGHGQLDFQAEARLINDNLLDFSHLSFVHAESFETGPEFAASPAKIKPIDRGIVYERWSENTYGASSRRTTEPMDNYMYYQFLVPGVLLMLTGVFPLGTAKACRYGAPALDIGQQLSFTSQAVTPMTERTSRYYFSWGPHVKDGTEAKRDMMMGLAAKAFGEDKAMIEAQQVVVDRTVDPVVMPTAHDKGVTMYNRLVQRLS